MFMDSMELTFFALKKEFNQVLGYLSCTLEQCLNKHSCVPRDQYKNILY